MLLFAPSCKEPAIFHDICLSLSKKEPCIKSFTYNRPNSWISNTFQIPSDHMTNRLILIPYILENQE